MKTRNIILTFIFSLLSISVYSQNLDSYMLKVDGGIGALAPIDIHSEILGSACLSNLNNPDLFVQTKTLYPSVSLYKYSSRSTNGTPVFGERIDVKLPYDLTANHPSFIVQREDRKVYLVWYTQGKLNLAEYSNDSRIFKAIKSRDFITLPHEPTTIGGYFDENDNLRVWASVSTSELETPSADPLTEEYIPYTRVGVWRGNLNKEGIYEVIYTGLLDGSSVSARKVSKTLDDVFVGYRSIKNITLDNSTEGIITGSYFGAIYYYERLSDGYTEKRYIVDSEGNALRHPSHKVSAISYPNANGVECDILAMGDGGFFYYKFTDTYTAEGKPIYDNPTSVMQTKAPLYAGSLPSPTVVDFDGDGVLDIIAGNAEGFIYFMKNKGTNLNPSFAQGVYLESNNGVIHIQPGYTQNMEGPLGARNGSVNPNVIDWDEDGALDILSNDSRGKHMIFRGTTIGGNLRKEAPIYLQDLELRGTSRCRPAVGKLNGKMAYITLDNEDELNFYWKIDDQNIKDGGKLRLSNNTVIKANRHSSLGTGRLRLDLADWNGDGRFDILLGVDALHEVAGVVSDHPKATALVLINTGTNEAPLFEAPRPILFKGQELDLGQNIAGVVACNLGVQTNSLPNLLVTDDRGRFYLLEQKNINPECDVDPTVPGNFVDKTPSSVNPKKLTSPTIVQHNGTLYVSYSDSEKTIIKKSINKGQTWTDVCSLNVAKDGSLFFVDNTMYLLGSSYVDNNCLILKSEDYGVTWTTPSSPTTGLLLASTASYIVKTTAMPALLHNGKIYKTVEQIDKNGVRKIAVMSASTSDDLLVRSKWTYSSYLPIDNSLTAEGTHWQEGNVLLLKDNTLAGIASIKGGKGDKGAMFSLSADGKTLTYKEVLDIQGANKKFVIKYDNESGRYWAVTNRIKDTSAVGNTASDLVYNSLFVISSTDLKTWTVEKEVVANNEYQTTGFLFTDWVFDGQDIITISSVSWVDCQGSVSDIEAPNYMVSFKIKNVK